MPSTPDDDPPSAYADRLAESQQILDGTSAHVPNPQHLAALSRAIDDLDAQFQRVRRMQRQTYRRAA